MLLLCLRDSSTDPLRLMTAALGFTTVELQMLTMPPQLDSTIKASSATVASRPPTNLRDLVVVMRHSRGGGGGGGGWHSHFYLIPRFGPSIYRSTPPPPPPPKKKKKKKHKKKQEFQELPKIFEILATPQNTPILYLDLKKRPKNA